MNWINEKVAEAFFFLPSAAAAFLEADWDDARNEERTDQVQLGPAEKQYFKRPSSWVCL